MRTILFPTKAVRRVVEKLGERRGLSPEVLPERVNQVYKALETVSINAKAELTRNFAKYLLERDTLDAMKKVLSEENIYLFRRQFSDMGKDKKGEYWEFHCIAVIIPTKSVDEYLQFFKEGGAFLLEEDKPDIEIQETILFEREYRNGEVSFRCICGENKPDKPCEHVVAYCLFELSMAGITLQEECLRMDHLDYFAY